MLSTYKLTGRDGTSPLESARVSRALGLQRDTTCKLCFYIAAISRAQVTHTLPTQCSRPPPAGRALFPPGTRGEERVYSSCYQSRQKAAVPPECREIPSASGEPTATGSAPGASLCGPLVLVCVAALTTEPFLPCSRMLFEALRPGAVSPTCHHVVGALSLNPPQTATTKTSCQSEKAPRRSVSEAAPRNTHNQKRLRVAEYKPTACVRQTSNEKSRSGNAPRIPGVNIGTSLTPRKTPLVHFTGQPATQQMLVHYHALHPTASTLALPR